MSVELRNLVEGGTLGRDPELAIAGWAAAYASTARDAGLTPEAMLVALKREVAAARPGATRRDARSSRAFLDRAVTLCIESYFADRATPPSAPSRPSTGER